MPRSKSISLVIVLSSARNIQAWQAQADCQGMPGADEVRRDGGIISLDITLEKNGPSRILARPLWSASRPQREARESRLRGDVKGHQTNAAGAHRGDIASRSNARRKDGYSVVRGHGLHH